MNRYFRMFGMAVAVLLAVSGVVQAATLSWYATSVPEMAAHRGATHYAVIKYGDFAAVTSTNTALSMTNAINANTGVEFVEMLLDAAFDTGNTNYTGSVALKIGDGSDDDLFLTSTELASDGSEVYVKYGPPHAYTVTSTPTKQTATALATATPQTASLLSGLTLQTVSLTDTNGVTALVLTGIVQTAVAAMTNLATTTVEAMTNATVASTATAGELRYKVYSTAGNLIATVTPNAEEALSANTSGEARLYFRLTKLNK